MEHSKRKEVAVGEYWSVGEGKKMQMIVDFATPRGPASEIRPRQVIGVENDDALCELGARAPLSGKHDLRYFGQHAWRCGILVTLMDDRKES